MHVFKTILAVIGGVTVLAATAWLLAGQQDGTASATHEDTTTMPIPPVSGLKPHSGCVLKNGAGAVCSSGLAAVVAYQRYGDDTDTMQQSYAQTVLQQAGCFVITNKGPSIQQMSHGRVAVSDGWIGVTMISVGPGGGEIDDRFLDGVCEKYQAQALPSPVGRP